MKKRLMIIGPKDSGKTTIARQIEKDGLPLRKVQNVVYGPKTIDVPGVYLESPWMHKHIIALQQSAQKIIVLMPINGKKKSYPPGFMNVFRLPHIGIITHDGGEISEMAYQKAREQLHEIGVKEPYWMIDLSNANDLLDFVEKNE